MTPLTQSLQPILQSPAEPWQLPGPEDLPRGWESHQLAMPIPTKQQGTEPTAWNTLKEYSKGL